MRLGYGPRKEDTVALAAHPQPAATGPLYSWPKEWGGPGWSAVQRMIFLEEIRRRPRRTSIRSTFRMIGPVLIQYGTDEQKQRFLPRAANLEDWWCQGFSEPGGGFRPRLAEDRGASREGDEYIVNGQKIWTSTAHIADWCFCLVRTDPQAKKRQKGSRSC